MADEPEDPFDGQDWSGWARYGRGPGAKWHRVREERIAGDLVKFPLCGGRTDPMPTTTVVMDYRWDPPSPDRCEECWPPGMQHPGIASDLPRSSL